MMMSLCNILDMKMSEQSKLLCQWFQTVHFQDMFQDHTDV